MELYVDKAAPNARRVLMFVAEKKLELRVIEINVAEQENRTPEFLAINPLGQVPVLKLADGLCISETMAICRYLDEISDSPSLFGQGAEQRAIVHMWSRRVEYGLFVPAVEYGHHTHPVFRERFDQIQKFADLNRHLIEDTYALLDSQLDKTRFIAGDKFSVADIVAYCGVELARLWDIPADRLLKALCRWQQEVSDRSSAAIARYA